MAPTQAPTTHEGFAIEVQELLPHPFAGRPTPPEDYRATVRISHASRLAGASPQVAPASVEHCRSRPRLMDSYLVTTR